MPRPVGKGDANTWQLRAWSSLEKWVAAGQPHSKPTVVAPPPPPNELRQLIKKQRQKEKQMQQKQKKSPARAPVRQVVTASVPGSAMSGSLSAAPSAVGPAATAEATGAAARKPAPAFEESVRLPCGPACMPALLYAWSGNTCGPPELDFLHAVGIEAGAHISIYESGGGGLCASVAASSPAMVGCVVAALSEAAILAQHYISQHTGIAADPHETIDDSVAPVERLQVSTSFDTPDLPRATAITADIFSRHDAFTRGVLSTDTHQSDVSVHRPASVENAQAELSDTAPIPLPASFVAVPVCRSNSPLEPGELPAEVVSPVSALLPGIHALHRERDESLHAMDSSAEFSASFVSTSSDLPHTSAQNSGNTALHKPAALGPTRLCIVSSPAANLTAESDDTGPSNMSISPLSDRELPREVGASSSEAEPTATATLPTMVECEQPFRTPPRPAGELPRAPFAITALPTVNLYFPAAASVSAAMIRDGLTTDAQHALLCVPVAGSPTACAGVKRSREGDQRNGSTEPLKTARTAESNALGVSKTVSTASDESTTTVNKLFASVLGMQLDVAMAKHMADTQIDVEPQLCSHQQTWVLVPHPVDERLAEKLQLSRERKQCHHCGHAGIHFASRRAARAMAQAMSCELFATLRTGSSSTT